MVETVNHSLDLYCDLVFSSTTLACSIQTLIPLKVSSHFSSKVVYGASRYSSLNNLVWGGGAPFTCKGMYASEYPRMMERIAGLPHLDKFL